MCGISKPECFKLQRTRGEPGIGGALQKTNCTHGQSFRCKNSASTFTGLTNLRRSSPVFFSISLNNHNKQPHSWKRSLTLPGVFFTRQGPSPHTPPFTLRETNHGLLSCMAPRTRSPRGGVLTEFAIIMPVLIILFLAGHDALSFIRDFEDIRRIKDETVLQLSQEENLERASAALTNLPAPYHHDRVIQYAIHRSRWDAQETDILDVKTERQPAAQTPDEVRVELRSEFNGIIFKGFRYVVRGQSIYLR